jgi:replicative superfamily II helicase
VELTGDVTPDMQAVAEADLIVTTPEKWDGISRSWQSRRYVTAVSLLVIDEIHLLGLYSKTKAAANNPACGRTLVLKVIHCTFS